MEDLQVKDSRLPKPPFVDLIREVIPVSDPWPAKCVGVAQTGHRCRWIRSASSRLRTVGLAARVQGLIVWLHLSSKFWRSRCFWILSPF